MFSFTFLLHKPLLFIKKAFGFDYPNFFLIFFFHFISSSRELYSRWKSIN
uniref:Uncharacterized protein n=1 Tax=Meloidogyne enterolobii TaxID=390850 RepID=A0A6V7XH60_MELEN|nr:unnamed protein product [Meloidogyne enterolobii]